MCFRDNRKRRKRRNNSGSSTKMKNKTQVMCNNIMRFDK
jgi:hypothetical protein